MTDFLVWDEFNSDRDSAWHIEAYDSESAAEKYAEEDVDGSIDGIYSGGHTVMVEDPEGVVRKFNVRVDYDPTFYATEVA